jgi:hypothetical protein
VTISAIVPVSACLPAADATGPIAVARKGQGRGGATGMETPDPMAEQILFICQPYVRQKGKLRVSRAEVFPTEAKAMTYAERLIQGGRAVGAEVVRQSGDSEMGDYAEPEFLARLGDVPVALD